MLRTWIVLSLISIIGLIQVGCKSKGFNRGELSSQLGLQKPVYNDQQIQEAFNKKANLPKPFKLGIFYRSPVSKQSSQEPEWRWTPEDTAVIDGFAEEMKSQGMVSQIVSISNSLVANESDIKSIRMAAASYQVDALLIVGGTGQIDKYENAWAWSYILLAPAFFVPGSQTDTLFLTNASLWDVRNEFLYIVADAEGMIKKTHPGALRDHDKDLFAQAKTESLKNLKTESAKMIQGQKISSQK